MTITHEPAAVAIDSILLATDFSGASERAADYARAIARKFNSTLDMVHVVDPSAVAICDEVVSPAATPHGQVCDAPNMERSHASFVESGVTTRAYTAEGHDAAQTLLGIAHNRHSNLIITGTRAKSGVGRLIMGSTAETLIRNSECPVLTIGPKANRPLDGNFDFRTIVYATDFSEQAAKAARYALAFAAHSNGRLCCCFVESDEIEVPAIQAERTARFTR